MSERYDPKYITETCNRCGGDGQYEIPQAGGDSIIVDCGTCGGLGVERTQRGDVFESNIVYGYEIFNATTDEDYNDLSDGNEDVYAHILALGVLDLSEGTRTRTKLWAMFGEETTTRANLEALLGE